MSMKTLIHGIYGDYWVPSEDADQFPEVEFEVVHIPTQSTHTSKHRFTTGGSDLTSLAVYRMLNRWNEMDPERWVYRVAK